MTSDQLLFGLVVGTGGALLASCGLMVARVYVADWARRLGLASLIVLFLCTAAISFGIADPVLISKIGSVPQPFFYGAVISIDRFSAMFIAAAAAVGFLSYTTLAKRNQSLVLLATLTVSGVASIGNIMGIGFFLAWTLALVWMMREHSGGSWRLLAMITGGWLSIAGLFVASGGALFSDLQAVANYAGSLSEGTLIFGTILSGLGAIGLAKTLIDWRNGSSPLSSSGALLLLIATMYVAWRTMLFIMPVLNAVLGVVMIAIGVVFLLGLSKDARVSSVLLSQLIVGLGLGIYAIANENWQLMNLAVFASVMMLLVGSVASAGLASLVGLVGEGRGLAKRAPWLSLYGALLVGGWSLVNVLGNWMFVAGVTLTVASPQADAVAVLLFVLTIVAIIIAMRSLGRLFGWYVHAFFGAAPEDAMSEPGIEKTWPIQVSSLMVVLAALLSPSFLSRIGGEALTLNVGKFSALISTGDGAFAPAALVLFVGVLAIAVSIVRGSLTTNDGGNVESEQDADARLVNTLRQKIAALVAKVNPVVARGVTVVPRLQGLVDKIRSRSTRFLNYRELAVIVFTIIVLALVAFLS